MADKTGISPKISTNCAAWLDATFRTRHTGATYILEAAPQLYRRTLHDLRGRFNRAELSLILDVFNATMLTPGLAGQHLAIQVEDGIALDGLKTKWAVREDFVARLRQLSVWECAVLEIWATGFWASLAGGTGGKNETDNWILPLLAAEKTPGVGQE